jgi:hypothetical protein
VRKKALVLGVAFLLSGIAFGADGKLTETPPVGTPQRPTVRLSPNGSGTLDSVISVSDLAFTPFLPTAPWTYVGPSYFRYFTAVPNNFGASIQIPSGAMIDYLGLGTCDNPGGSWSVGLFSQSTDGVTYTTIGGLTSSAHGATTPCGIDYTGLLGFQFTANAFQSVQIQVTQNTSAATDGSTTFGSVEIWWHQVVSPAPVTPTFNDVPTSDPGFQYIEALVASGVTAGCGGGNYCPDATLTRRQMAVFLAKALGLSWPD